MEYQEKSSGHDSPACRVATAAGAATPSCQSGTVPSRFWLLSEATASRSAVLLSSLASEDHGGEGQRPHHGAVFGFRVAQFWDRIPVFPAALWP